MLQRFLSSDIGHCVVFDLQGGHRFLRNVSRCPAECGITFHMTILFIVIAFRTTSHAGVVKLVNMS